MKFLRAETGWSNFGKILQLKQDFAIGPFAITVNDCLALFVVLGQRPRCDGLNVASAKTGTAIGVEHVATARLVKHGPNLEPFSKFPAAAVQDSATPA